MTPARRFAFKLALAFGYPNPDRMLAEMPFRIWREWQTYYQYDPFGNERLDVLVARMMAWNGEVHRQKKSDKHYKVAKFMPKWGPDDPITPDALFNKFALANQALGGRFVDKRKKRGESD
jgi:hypothetical protein